MSESLLEKYYFEKTFGLRPEVESTQISDTDSRTFRKLCDEELSKDLSPTELVLGMKFIEQIEQLNSRCPFLNPLRFVEDFLDGEYSTDLINKYHLIDYADFNFVKETLNLRGNRVKKQITNARSINLSNSEWNNVYQFIVVYSVKFQEALYNMLFYNILRASLISYISKLQNGITESDILNDITRILDDHVDKIKILGDKETHDKFIQFRQRDHADTVHELIIELLQQNLIRISVPDRRIEINQKYDKIAADIIELSAGYPNGIFHSNFYRLLSKRNPFLKLCPRLGMFESALAELQENNEITVIHSYWRYRPFRDTIIRSDFLAEKANKLKTHLIEHGEIAFFGRRISAEGFINELKIMEKGDFYDREDQVTRIAGLFLSLSPQIEAKHAQSKEFDFSIKISKDRNDKFHLAGLRENSLYLVKVLINEQIDQNLIQRLKLGLRPYARVLLVSFVDIEPEVQRLLNQESMVVFGEQDLMLLARSIEAIPSRVNSISKIMYGDNIGKLARINSIDYESRIASISVIPDMENLTVSIGSLREVWMGDAGIDNYESFSKNYEQLLSILGKYAEIDKFRKGLFNPKISDVRILTNVLKDNGIVSTIETTEKQLDANDEICLLPEDNYGSNCGKRNVIWEIKTDDCVTKISYGFSSECDSTELNNANVRIRKLLPCNCFYWDGKTHSFRLCSHLISSLDLIARKSNFLDNTWGNRTTNIATRLIRRFTSLNNCSIIESFAGLLEADQLTDFISFVNNVSCLDWEGDALSQSWRIKNRGAILEYIYDKPQARALFSEIEVAIPHMTKSDLQQIVSALEDAVL